MSRKILNPFCSVDQSSIPSMKYGDRMGCPLREHLKNIMQRISLNLNPELRHDENGCQDLAERVLRHDFASNAGIFPLLSCSNVRLFKCFPVRPCSLFEMLTSQGENTNFHPDRAPHRDCDHRDSCGYASACVEQGKRESVCRAMPFQSETDRACTASVWK